MDTQSLIASLLALSGVHAGGHLSEAGNSGFSPRMNLSSLTERWENPSKQTQTEAPYYILDGNKIPYGTTREVANPNYTPKSELMVQGSGFTAQDNLNRAMNTPESNAANLLYKLLYAQGITLGKNMNYKGGDVEAIEKLSGNKYTKQMIQASAILGALGIPVDFTMVEGGKGAGPGLVFRKQF